MTSYFGMVSVARLSYLKWFIDIRFDTECTCERKLRVRKGKETKGGFKNEGRLLFHMMAGIMWFAVKHTKQRFAVGTSSC